MAVTGYQRTCRLLACAECGGPQEVGLEGGSVTCRYCSAVTQWAPSREAQEIAALRARRQVSEGERMRQLRAQDHRPRAIPEEVRSLTICGELTASTAEAALTRWKGLISPMRQLQPHHVEELFFVLSELLSMWFHDHKEIAKARLVLETGMTLCSDTGLRQLLRCRLVQFAAHAGNLEAAKSWLGACDDKSTDLETDSAYRIAASFVFVQERRYQDILNLLGADAAAVPIADAYDNTAALLRAQAAEEVLNSDAAARALHSAALKEPLRALAAERERHRWSPLLNAAALGELQHRLLDAWGDRIATTCAPPPPKSLSAGIFVTSILVALSFISIGASLAGGTVPPTGDLVFTAIALPAWIFMGWHWIGARADIKEHERLVDRLGELKTVGRLRRARVVSLESQSRWLCHVVEAGEKVEKRVVLGPRDEPPAPAEELTVLQHSQHPSVVAALVRGN